MRDTNIIIKVQIVTVTFEDIVVGHLENDEQVAVDTAALRGMSLLRNRHLHPVIHTGRNIDGDDFLARHRAVAMTMRARIFDNLARATAFRTYRCLLDDTEHTALLAHHLAAAVTVGTSCDAVRIFRARAVTVRTHYLFVDLDLLLDGCGHLLQIQLHLDADVTAFAHATLLTATAEAAKTTEAAKPATESPAENIGKMAENVVEVHAGEIAGLITHAGVAELVVTRLLVGVAQHIIRLSRLLELLLGFLIAGIAVRVVLHGLLAVGLFYLIC